MGNLKTDTDELIYKQTQTHRYSKKFMVTKGKGKGGGRRGKERQTPERRGLF